MQRRRDILGKRRGTCGSPCDRRVGDGAGGSWRVFVDVVVSSVEASAGKLAVGARKNGMVCTGRSVVSPELLEVGSCAVVARSRWMPVDVRRRGRWGEDRNDAWVDGPGVVAASGGGAREGVDTAVSRCCRVAHDLLSTLVTVNQWFNPYQRRLSLNYEVWVGL